MAIKYLDIMKTRKQIEEAINIIDQSLLRNIVDVKIKIKVDLMPDKDIVIQQKLGAFYAFSIVDDTGKYVDIAYPDASLHNFDIAAQAIEAIIEYKAFQRFKKEGLIIKL